MHLSVIIPSLSRPLTALSLGARVAELLPALDVEVLVVVPSTATRPPDTAKVRFINDDGRGGVYMAYRAGLAQATGEYCWFMGDDDYPLDGASELSPALLAAQADLIAAPVIFSTGRLYRPTQSRLKMHFLNWCQQGVIYRRSLLARVRFYRRLVVQADQFVNIKLRSDPNLHTLFITKPICVFGVNGVSGRMCDTRYASLRKALAKRTLSFGAYAVFCALLPLQPMIKRIVKLR